MFTVSPCQASRRCCAESAWAAAPGIHNLSARLDTRAPAARETAGWSGALLEPGKRRQNGEVAGYNTSLCGCLLSQWSNNQRPTEREGAAKYNVTDLAAVGGHCIWYRLLPRAVAEPLVVPRGVPPMRSPEVWVLQLRLPVPAGQRSAARLVSGCPLKSG